MKHKIINWTLAILVLVFFVVLPIGMLFSSPGIPDYTHSKIVPAREETYVRSYVRNIQTRNFANILQLVDKTHQTAKLRDNLNKLAALFPPGSPISTKLIGYHKTIGYSTKTGSSHIKRYTYLFQYKNGYYVSNILIKNNNFYKIYVNNIGNSLNDILSFHISGKDTFHYTFLTAAIIIYIFWIFSIYTCIFMQDVRHKWAWLLFMFFGFGAVILNWTSGDISRHVFFFRWPAVQIYEEDLAPWMVRISLPLGAIVFWLRRLMIRRPAHAIPADGTAVSTAQEGQISAHHSSL